MNAKTANSGLIWRNGRRQTPSAAQIAGKLTDNWSKSGISIVQLSKNIAGFLLICCSMIVPHNSSASQLQSLPSIVMQAEAFIEQYDYQSPYAPEVRIKSLDKRLRLQACFEPLQISFTREDLTYGNTSLTVKCPKAPYWKILLPISVALYDDVLVTRRPVLRGEMLEGSSVRVKKQNISGLRQGYYRKDTDLTHLQSRRNLRSGTVLTPNNVTARLMVKTGQLVTIVLDYKGIAIRTTGEALQSARLGEIIRVKNNQTSKIVEGIVQGDALVRVNI